MDFGFVPLEKEETKDYSSLGFVPTTAKESKYFLEDRNTVVATKGTSNLDDDNYLLQTQVYNKPKNSFMGKVEVGKIAGDIFKREAVSQWKDNASIDTMLGFNFSKGFASLALGAPQWIGGLLKSEGETMSLGPGKLDKALLPVFPYLYLSGKARQFQAVHTDVDESLTDMGNTMIASNKRFMSLHDIEADEGKLNRLAFDLGSGGASIMLALGLTYATKNPAVVAPLFAAMQKGQVYEESRQAGKDPREAELISNLAGVIEGGLEYLGLEVFVNYLRGSKTFQRIGLRVLTEGIQEFSQQAGEETLLKGFDVRDTGWGEIAQKSLYAGAIGVIVGAPVSTSITLAENNGLIGDLRRAGLNDQQAHEFITVTTEKMREQAKAPIEDMMQHEINEMDMNSAELEELQAEEEAAKTKEPAKNGSEIKLFGPKAGGIVHDLSPKEREQLKTLKPDQLKLITLSRDVDVKVGNETKHYKKGEDIYIYQDNSTGKAIVKDGEYAILPKKAVTQVEQAGSEIKSFMSPEEQGVKEVVKGKRKLFEGWTEKEIRKHHKELTGNISSGNLDDLKAEISEIESFDDMETGVQFAQYQSLGGENYREVVFTAPVERQQTFEDFRKQYFERFPDSDLTANEVRDIYSKSSATIPKQGGLTGNQTPEAFRSSHFDEPNPISHARISDVTVDGKKYMAIEEIQSDWAREGRKKGFAGSGRNIIEKRGDNYWIVDKATGTPSTENNGFPNKQDAERQLKSQGVPFHPLLKNWQEFTMKKLVARAVAEGYDGITWVTGEQTADRYSLEKKVNQIGWQEEDGVKRLNIDVSQGKVIRAEIKPDGTLAQDRTAAMSLDKNLEGKHISDVIGKDLGKQVLDDSKGLLKGQDLKIGGEWAKNLYGSIEGKNVKGTLAHIPTILKKMGGEIGTVGVSKPVPGFPEFTKDRKITQPSVLITPQMRAKVIGQPKAGGKSVLTKKQSQPSDQSALEQMWDKVKDIWFGNKDVAVLQSKTEKVRLQEQILAVSENKVQGKMYDEAIQIYLDSKRSPNHISEYWENLTDEQKTIVELSQNLPAEIIAVADQIAELYKASGENALESDVIRNVLDNYVARVWDLESKPATETFRKFGTTTRHAKQRKFDTILEGWAQGYELKVKGATSNLQILKEEMAKTIADKQFMQVLGSMTTVEGKPVLSDKQLEDYERVQHTNFKVWRHAGKAVQGEVYGKNTFVGEDGALFERRDLYAPKEYAAQLNNILGVSALKGMGGKLGQGIDFLTKYNALIKSFVLQSSFFHHLAFARSYYFGTNNKKWEDMSFRQAYKQGLSYIDSADPILMLGVRKGLTLGRSQEWDESLLREKSGFTKKMEQFGAAKKIIGKLATLREEQADFLFNKLGAGLKSKAFVLEYGNYMKEHPNADPDMAARATAELINNDFGGLHLGRLGRNPTAQHIFRLLCLAPDWTESNMRTVADMFKKAPAGTHQVVLRQISRKFWMGVLWKSQVATVLANVLMAAFDRDDEEARGMVQRFLRNYKKAWQAGKLRWLEVDVTPIYKATGGKDDQRRYFTVIGHFKDPIKWLVRNEKDGKFGILNPVALKHKASIIGGIGFDYFTGKDWAGRRYTSVKELIGVDTEKGYYKTSRKGKYHKGDPKFGKLKGQTITYDFKGSSMVMPEQMPSFIAAQAGGSLPVQIQNLIGWLAGETAGFEAMARSLGFGVSIGYEKKDDDKTSDFIGE